jgi:stearoyl-CoA desaturase (delta-9 desaturase)
VHRRHHQHPDDQPDPHSPFVNFFWGHVGWLLVRNTDLERLSLYTRYARHLAEDRFYLRFERIEWYGGVVLASWLAFYLAGFSAGWLIEQTFAGASQFALSVLIWGVFVRTVLVWHITWSVNSVTHLWGYRRYATGDGSRNNILIGLISSGEGWHNNHHSDPRTAKNGRRWWEFDLTYLTIRALAATGLVSGVILPNPRIAEIGE